MDKELLKTVKYWGASTSAHQAEGKTHNQWTVWELAHAAELAKEAELKYAHWLPSWPDIKAEASRPENYVSGVAVDHYERYKEDFDLAKELNLNALRISIEWSRVEPEEGKWDEVEVEHYRAVLRALKKRGIKPFVGLWHWTIPVWFEQKGGFSKRRNLVYFERFAQKMAVELKEHLSYVITINEANIYAGLSFRTGEWPPQERSIIKTTAVYINLISAHKRVYKLLKGINPQLKIGLAHHFTHFHLGDNTLPSKVSRWLQDTFWNRWVIDRSREYHDFIGINYYQSDRLVWGRKQNLNVKINDMGWEMRPADLEHVLLDAHRRWGKPLVVTENGVADAKDQYRKWWLEQTLPAIARAVKQGADVEGYLHWALMDNFEWSSGFWPRFGLIEVDRETLARKIRPSAKLLANFIRTARSRSAGR